MVGVAVPGFRRATRWRYVHARCCCSTARMPIAGGEREVPRGSTGALASIQHTPSPPSHPVLPSSASFSCSVSSRPSSRRRFFVGAGIKSGSRLVTEAQAPENSRGVTPSGSSSRRLSTCVQGRGEGEREGGAGRACRESGGEAVGRADRRSACPGPIARTAVRPCPLPNPDSLQYLDFMLLGHGQKHRRHKGRLAQSHSAPVSDGQRRNVALFQRRQRRQRRPLQPDAAKLQAEVAGRDLAPHTQQLLQHGPRVLVCLRGRRGARPMWVCVWEGGDDRAGWRTVLELRCPGLSMTELAWGPTACPPRSNRGAVSTVHGKHTRRAWTAHTSCTPPPPNGIA